MAHIEQGICSRSNAINNITGSNKQIKVFQKEFDGDVCEFTSINCLQ